MGSEFQTASHSWPALLSKPACTGPESALCGPDSGVVGPSPLARRDRADSASLTGVEELQNIWRKRFCSLRKQEKRFCSENIQNTTNGGHTVASQPVAKQLMVKHEGRSWFQSAPVACLNLGWAACEHAKKLSYWTFAFSYANTLLSQISWVWPPHRQDKAFSFR